MRCTNCNAPIGDGASFCASCGQPVIAAGPQVPGPSASPPPPALAPPAAPGRPTPGAPPSPPPPPGPQTWGGLERPSYAPTILISIFFGIFGLIPAVRHSRMARERGYSSSGYWWAFGLPIAISIALSVALVVSLVLTAHQINDNLSVGSGTVPAPATTPATSPAATKPAPRGGSGDTAPGAITTSASCPPDLSATLNKPSWASPPPMSIDPSGTYTATVTTDVGSFTIQLDPAAAPETVNSFVFLAQHHYYDCVVFHRVIQTFMDQTGDPTGTGEGGPGYQFADELPSQATPQYPIGSVAMANSGPNTNGSQFFIVTGSEGEDLPPSYSLFGTVISGMDVVDKINADGSAASSSTGTPTNLHRMISVTISES